MRELVNRIRVKARRANRRASLEIRSPWKGDLAVMDMQIQLVAWGVGSGEGSD